MRNWGVGFPVSNWMSHLPVTDVEKVRKKQKCRILALERTRVSFTLRDEAWFLSNALCLYGFYSLLSTHYNSWVAKACTFPFLSEGVLAKVDLSCFPFWKQGIIFFAEIKGGFFVPWQYIAALGLSCLDAACASPAHGVVVEGYRAEEDSVEEASSPLGLRNQAPLCPASLRWPLGWSWPLPGHQVLGVGESSGWVLIMRQYLFQRWQELRGLYSDGHRAMNVPWELVKMLQVSGPSFLRLKCEVLLGLEGLSWLLKQEGNMFPDVPFTPYISLAEYPRRYWAHQLAPSFDCAISSLTWKRVQTRCPLCTTPAHWNITTSFFFFLAWHSTNSLHRLLLPGGLSFWEWGVPRPFLLCMASIYTERAVGPWVPQRWLCEWKGQKAHHDELAFLGWKWSWEDRIRFQGFCDRLYPSVRGDRGKPQTVCLLLWLKAYI